MPLSILPQGNFDGVRFHRDADLAALTSFRQAIIRRVAMRYRAARTNVETLAEDPRRRRFRSRDRPRDDGPIHGYLAFEHQQVDTKDHLRVTR